MQTYRTRADIPDFLKFEIRYDHPRKMRAMCMISAGWRLWSITAVCCSVSVPSMRQVLLVRR